MVLSSRDRRLVSVEIVWLGLSPERRRLRFSFQINNVKDRDRVSPALLFSAGSRRRRLSSGRPLSCQPILSDFFARARKVRIWAKTSLRPNRGVSPTKSVAIRLKLRNITICSRKSRGFYGPLDLRRGRCGPQRGAACLVAVPLSVNRLFRTLLTDPDDPEADERRPSCQAREPRFLIPTGGPIAA